MKKQLFSTRMLAVMGILIALEIVIAQFGTFRPTQSIKVSPDFVPVVITAILYGPLPAMIMSILADVLGAFLFPVGPYFPGFTLTAALTGLLYGLLLRDRQDLPHTAAAVLLQQWVLSFLLNTLWLHVLYGSPYKALLLTRIPQCLVMTVVQMLLIPVLARAVKELRPRLGA